jgi:hypothetical protein
MRLAGAGSADQHSIALFGQKGAARQIADQRLVDRGTGEMEVVDILGQRQLGDGQLILDRRACSAISALSKSPTMRGGSCRRLMPVVITSSPGRAEGLPEDRLRRLGQPAYHRV